MQKKNHVIKYRTKTIYEPAGDVKQQTDMISFVNTNICKDTYGGDISYSDLAHPNKFDCVVDAGPERVRIICIHNTVMQGVPSKYCTYRCWHVLKIAYSNSAGV